MTAVRYAASATYGSEAYDLTRLPGFGEPQEEVRTEPTHEELLQERLAERARVREEARALERAKRQVFGIPLLAIVGGIVAAIMLVTVLMGYIELTAIAGKTKEVRSSIAELTERNERLKLQYEMTFDMEAIETYAINILGMTKASSEGSGTLIYRADKAEILAEDETAGIRAMVVGFLKSISEYFE